MSEALRFRFRAGISSTFGEFIAVGLIRSPLISCRPEFLSPKQETEHSLRDRRKRRQAFASIDIEQLY